MISEERIGFITDAAKMFMAANPTQKRNYDVDDLINEAVLALLEGYAGLKVDGDLRYAVKLAAARLSQVECREQTSHSFTVEEGSKLNSRFDEGEDYVAELEIEDWIETVLDEEEQFMVNHLRQGFSQSDIAAMLGVSSATISERVKALRIKMLKGGFNVN